MINERGRDLGVVREPQIIETMFMIVVEQAGRQGLAPCDLDNDSGEDVLRVIATAIVWPSREPKTIFVTPEWRRVVISARNVGVRPPRKLVWRQETGWQHA